MSLFSSFTIFAAVFVILSATATALDSVGLIASNEIVVIFIYSRFGIGEKIRAFYPTSFVSATYTGL